jgi:hypothetical protein
MDHAHLAIEIGDQSEYALALAQQEVESMGSTKFDGALSRQFYGTG